MNMTETPDTELDFGDELEVQETEVAEAPAPAPAPAKPLPQTIPYDRFAEVNDAKKRAEEAAAAAREEAIRLQERLRLLEQQAAKQPEPPKVEPVDVKALLKQRNNAILEGDDDKVAEIEAQLEAERTRKAEEAATARIRAELEAERVKKAEEQAKAAEAELQAAAVEIVTKYPFLNSTSPDADKDAIDDVLALRQRNIDRGMSPAQALKKAVERFAKDFDARIGAVETSEPNKGAESKLRNAKAAAAQPPSLNVGKSAGSSDVALDVEKMTREQWAQLPESEREKYLA